MNYVGRAPSPVGMPIVLGDTNPVGMIGWYHTPPDPTYLRLNGQIVSKTAYPELWVIAQSFLTADQVLNPGLYRDAGGDNFALPKFDGLFVRSQGQYDANRASAALGVLQQDALQDHTHTAFNTSLGAAAAGATVGQPGGSGPALGARVANETRAVNIALVPCVKALRTTIFTPANSVGPGRLLQTAQHVRTDYSSQAGQVPLDDTIPQITEGNEYLTVINFVPQVVGSRIRLSAIFCFTVSAVTTCIGSLFRAGTANALASAIVGPSNIDYEQQMILGYELFVADLNPITFSFRAGPAAPGTCRMNGRGARLLGGAYTSFLRVEEISQ